MLASVCLSILLCLELKSLDISFSSVQSLSRVPFFVTPWTAARQPFRSITNSQSLPKLCPSSRWCHRTISSSVVPFSYLQFFPSTGSFPMSQIFASGGQSIGVSASTSVLPMNTQDWNGLAGSHCSPKDSQNSSPAPQFENINSSALSLLYNPIHTSIHDY